MTVYIFDPSLVTELGHHFYAAKAYLHALRTGGQPCRIICNTEASNAVLELPAEPYFRDSGYDTSVYDREADAFQAARLRNHSLLNELIKLKRYISFRDNDLVYFPNSTALQIMAVTQWIGTFADGECPRFGMSLLNDPDSELADEARRIAIVFFERAFEGIPKNLRPRIAYSCETKIFGEKMALLLGRDPIVMPTMLHQGLCSWRDRAACQEPPLVSYLGHSQRSRGVELLPEIIEQTQRHRPDTTFLIQISTENEDTLSQFRKLFVKHVDRVKVIEGPLASAQWIDILRKTTVMLLPYDQKSYRNRGSGIFLECKAAGIPVIVPANTAIGTEAKSQGWGVTFDSFDATAVSTALISALDGWTRLQTAAQEVARDNQYDSASFFDNLLREAGGSSNAEFENAVDVIFRDSAELSNSLETTFYGKCKRGVLTLRRGVLRFRATSPRDHLATPFWSFRRPEQYSYTRLRCKFPRTKDQPVLKGILRFALPQALVQEFIGRVEFQDQDYRPICVFGGTIGRDPEKLMFPMIEQVCHLSPETTKVRMVFYSYDTVAVVIPEAIEIAHFATADNASGCRTSP